MKKILLLCLVYLSICVSAHSSIIDWTVNSTGDAFMDDVSGLVWMDVDTYYNMTPNQVQASLTTGFSIATLDQMNAMIASAGSGYTHLANVMGDALQGNGPSNIIYGFFDDQDSNPNLSTAYVYSHYTSPNDYLHIADNNFNIPDWTAYLGGYLGAFVVHNPVPIPSTILLFGFGLLGLAGVNRRKK